MNESKSSQLLDVNPNDNLSGSRQDAGTPKYSALISNHRDARTLGQQQYFPTVRAVNQTVPSSIPQYPQVVYLPHQPASVALSTKPVAFRQTCFEVILKSVSPCWYLILICFLVLVAYIYRIPAYNDNLKLQIELAKIRMKEEEIRSHARVREAEINRDLTIDVEKLKLANEQSRHMESLKISKELAEKYLESNMEVMEKSSGIFNRDTTTQKRTFLDSSDTFAFAQLFTGYTGWGLDTFNNVRKLLHESPSEISDEEANAEEDETNTHVDL